MKKLLTYLLLLLATAASAQTAGDYASFRKSVGPGDIKTYYTPVNSSLYSVNSSGNFALLAQSTFLTPTQGNAAYSLLGHTHLSAHITDASLGGNGASDSGLLAKYGTEGQLRGSVVNGSQAAVWGESLGTGYAGLFTGGAGVARMATPIAAAELTSTGLVIDAGRTTSGTVAHFGGLTGTGLDISETGAASWTSATGAQTTATNLPAFGTSTKGVVPASGGGTTNFLRADGTWAAAGGGSGTVTSVSVTTANGVSGSVATATTTPAISLTLGAITPTSVAASGAVSGSNLSGTNTGDQTSIAGITGSLSDFNTALTGADFATGGGTATGTNTGDQTNISGNAATVTTNANLTGPITSVGNATTVAETELSALASTTSAANKVPYFTGSGTATTADLKIGTEVAYSGTITWTAGTAPSSTANLRQFYMQVGNMVTWEIALTYAVAGSTVTGISLTFPTEFPTPAIPTGFTGANVKLWQCFPTRLLTSLTSATLNGATHMIQRNAADTGFEISGSVFASGSYRTFHLGGIYFTAP